MSAAQQHYEKLAASIIKNLKKRRISGFYCPTIEEAKTKALSFVPDGGTIGLGGSVTLSECGIIDALRGRNDLKILTKGDAKTPEEAEQIMRDTFFADCYFMSTNAITIDGELVNIDNTGNRVASLIFGPKNVVIVAGMNKVTHNVEDALHRVRDIASPPNCIRLGRNTPCTETGHCMDCYAEGCLCNQIVVTRRSLIEDRIKIILVGEKLGF